MDFSEWLENEIKKRGWTQSQLAQRGRIKPNTVSRVLSRERNPGPEFCRAIARAFGYPQEYVFRKAGLINDPQPSSYLSQISEHPIDATTDQILQIVLKLTPDERAELLDLLHVHLNHRSKQHG